MKKIPIIEINTDEVIKNWNKAQPLRLTTFMNQGNLERYFKSQPKWKVKSTIHSQSMLYDLGVQENYGIYLYVKYKGGFALSIVAGQGLYCSPKKKTTDYSSVEIALMKNDKFLSAEDAHDISMQTNLFDRGGICGYCTSRKLKQVKEYVESL